MEWLLEGVVYLIAATEFWLAFGQFEKGNVFLAGFLAAVGIASSVRAADLRA